MNYEAGKDWVTLNSKNTYPVPGRAVYHIVWPGGVVVAAAALGTLNNDGIETME